ncbi:hypothetical protein Tco_0455977 [Tanacetum coccineum]
MCEEEVPFNNNIEKQIGDFVDMASEAVEQGMNANVSNEIGCAKGKQVSNHVVKKGNLEFLVCKEVANPGVNELVDKGRPLKRKRIWKAFGGNTRDLGSFGEETDKTTNLHQHLSRISTQKLETASQITRDAVTTISKTALQDLKTASDPAQDLEYSYHDGVTINTRRRRNDFSINTNPFLGF